jgi:hypothetical protein
MQPRKPSHQASTKSVELHLERGFDYIEFYTNAFTMFGSILRESSFAELSLKVSLRSSGSYAADNP